MTITNLATTENGCVNYSALWFMDVFVMEFCSYKNYKTQPQNS